MMNDWVYAVKWGGFAVDYLTGPVLLFQAEEYDSIDLGVEDSTLWNEEEQNSADDSGRAAGNNAEKNGGPSSRAGEKPSSPPAPESVPVVAPLTVNDTLKLHDNRDRNQDDISMIVNIDDQSERSTEGVTGKGGAKEDPSTAGAKEKKEEAKSDESPEGSAKDGGQRSEGRGEWDGMKTTQKKLEIGKHTCIKKSLVPLLPSERCWEKKKRSP
ncbi:unnamed protein product [Cyprideis torosa]|uniref:Uncharacterized protein n=1 Tax=Cyprideis torosa TaxID=163714 RepID=A0A7R8WH67_9CRUS|nr:unnamed protein product [Cyprideis torosa]CAG0898984.1 unnamed protein product [Cyprideis torosa]